MTNIIEILEDTTKILESVFEMQDNVSALKKALEDDHLAAAKQALTGLEETFNNHTLEPSMGLYKQIHGIFHMHVGEGTKKTEELKKLLNLDGVKKVLKKQEKFLKKTDGV